MPVICGSQLVVARELELRTRSRPKDYENTGGFCRVCDIFYFTTLFKGFQIRRLDPFCLVMIRSNRAIITISLQFSRHHSVKDPTLRVELYLLQSQNMMRTLRFRFSAFRSPVLSSV